MSETLTHSVDDQYGQGQPNVVRHHFLYPRFAYPRTIDQPKAGECSGSANESIERALVEVVTHPSLSVDVTPQQDAAIHRAQPFIPQLPPRMIMPVVEALVLNQQHARDPAAALGRLATTIDLCAEAPQYYGATEAEVQITQAVAAALWQQQAAINRVVPAMTRRSR